MTSLYDQFHSEKNKNYIYNLIDELIIENIGKSIKGNMEYLTYYNNKLREIFIESDEIDLVGLNKELLSHHLKYFINELKVSDESNESNINTNKPIIQKSNNEKINADVITQYNNFIESRDVPLKITNKNIEPIIVEESSKQEFIKEIPFQEKEQKQEREIIQEKKPIQKEIILFNSANRINIESNRFNYQIKCDKKINKLEKCIIPIEQNIHFSNPILNLKINELNLDINIYLTDTYELNNYTYGVYRPDDTLKIDSNIQKELNIEILSIYNNDKYNNDIYECKLEDNLLILENIKDFKVNDIVSINSEEFIKIIEIENDKLKLENIPKIEDDKKDKVYVMNMNLQNTLVFY